MCHTSGEEGVGFGGLLIHMRVKRITGEIGEMLDILQRYCARFGPDGFADLKVIKHPLKRMFGRRNFGSTLEPDAANRR